MTIEFEQEWRGSKLGGRYAFPARMLDVVTGWPYRIGIKALLELHKSFNSPALNMHRVGRSRLFNLEGPTELVNAVEAIVLDCRREGMVLEDKRLLKNCPDRFWDKW